MNIKKLKKDLELSGLKPDLFIKKYKSFNKIDYVDIEPNTLDFDLYHTLHSYGYLCEIRVPKFRDNNENGFFYIFCTPDYLIKKL